jgi:hypothetical protein
MKMKKAGMFLGFVYYANDNRKFVFSGLLFFTFHFSLFTLCVFAQDEPKDAAPPPLKILYKEEKSQLEAEDDIKRRTKLALELMESRLKKAEILNTQNDFNAMFTELGGFHAVMDNTLNFLNRHDNGGGKILNNYKRMELSLRSYIARLEVIRRELPLKYEFYVRGLIKQVREARTKAVEPMFDDSVVTDDN